MFIGVAGLLPHEGMFGSFTEDMWSELPAGIAINAGRIDEEIACDVLSDSQLEIGHDSVLVLRIVVMTYAEAKWQSEINRLTGNVRSSSNTKKLRVRPINQMVSRDGW